MRNYDVGPRWTDSSRTRDESGDFPTHVQNAVLPSSCKCCTVEKCSICLNHKAETDLPKPKNELRVNPHSASKICLKMDLRSKHRILSSLKKKKRFEEKNLCNSDLDKDFLGHDTRNTICRVPEKLRTNVYLWCLSACQSSCRPPGSFSTCGCILFFSLHPHPKPFSH